ncbi:hypothetical protein DH2020_046244 [Rehmannia glutinosa]|uniref:Protein DETOXIFICATION n=1 Tax=Rehmannia glutinosa TaxID=99300 RepID=A0ABR0UBV6_REHGL
MEENHHTNAKKRVWVETKKLWRVVGPAIFSRIVSYSMFVITQAFAGHLGDLELAAMSIASNVVIGFDFGLLRIETLCGQAYGAKEYCMLGIYLQRSWIVLFLCCLFLLPIFFFATPILKLLGQPADVAELSGVVAMCFIPLHFSFAIQFPLQRFLQCQLKNSVIAWVNFGALLVHILLNWLVVYKLQLGVVGTAISLSLSYWLIVFGLFLYRVRWMSCVDAGFLRPGVFGFVGVSQAVGFFRCHAMHEHQRLGNDDSSGFFAGTGVRVANELGAGNGKGAKFATIVSVTQSLVIGLIFSVLIMFFHQEIALIFTTSKIVLEAVSKLSLLLAFTILLNSVQPILSGVAVGSGWQSYVAYINLGCYYLVGVPLGFLMEWVFHLGVMGIWAGMIFGGTLVQTAILAIITMRCDWEKEKDYRHQVWLQTIFKCARFLEANDRRKCLPSCNWR